MVVRCPIFRKQRLQQAVENNTREKKKAWELHIQIEMSQCLDSILQSWKSKIEFKHLKWNINQRSYQLSINCR